MSFVQVQEPTCLFNLPDPCLPSYSLFYSHLAISHFLLSDSNSHLVVVYITTFLVRIASHHIASNSTQLPFSVPLFPSLSIFHSCRLLSPHSRPCPLPPPLSPFLPCGTHINTVTHLPTYPTPPSPPLHSRRRPVIGEYPKSASNTSTVHQILSSHLDLISHHIRGTI